MNINEVVCIRSNWFAEIKTGTIIGEHPANEIVVCTLVPPTTGETVSSLKLKNSKGKYNKRISFTCSVSILHVMQDPRKQPAVNCGLGNIACQVLPTSCFLWRLLRCVWLEAALLDWSVCVIKVLESGRLLMLSLAVLWCHTIDLQVKHTSLLSRVTWV